MLAPASLAFAKVQAEQSVLIDYHGTVETELRKK